MVSGYSPFRSSSAVHRRGSSRPPLGTTKGVDDMSEAPEVLGKKFLEFFRWEKRKRREQILITLVCYSVLAALLLLPFYFLLPQSFLRWFIPLPLFALSAPFWFLKRRWRREDSARALVRLDKALNSDE